MGTRPGGGPGIGERPGGGLRPGGGPGIGERPGGGLSTAGDRAWRRPRVGVSTL